MQVVRSETLSTPGDIRYICVDEETGEVLDDAQSYGFRTKRGAYAAFKYKSIPPAVKRKQKADAAIVRAFLASCGHRGDIETAVVEIRFRAQKEHAKARERDKALDDYLDTIGFDFASTGVTRKFFLEVLDGKH